MSVNLVNLTRAALRLTAVGVLGATTYLTTPWGQPALDRIIAGATVPTQEYYASVDGRGVKYNGCDVDSLILETHKFSAQAHLYILIDGSIPGCRGLEEDIKITDTISVDDGTSKDLGHIYDLDEKIIPGLAIVTDGKSSPIYISRIEDVYLLIDEDGPDISIWANRIGENGGPVFPAKHLR
jgi:hypothetical protein